MIKPCDIAIVGATGLVGESLLELLEESGFPLGRLHLIAGPDSAGTRAEFRGGYVVVQELAGFDFSQAQLALFVSNMQVAAEFAPRAAAAGCVVIDTSSQFRGDPDVPLIIPELNAAAIAGHRSRRILAVPSSAVVQLLLALRSIHKEVGIENMTVTTLRPVSDRGRQAVEELASQTASLMNGQPIETYVFPKQIAFNCLPDIDEVDENGYTKYEMQMLAETRRVLGDEAMAAQFSCLTVPVFYGQVQEVNITTHEPLSVPEARRLLQATPGLKVAGKGIPGNSLSPVEIVGQDSIYVGRIRKNLTNRLGLSMWVVADNIRSGVAGNVLRLAETFVKGYL
jgi:aspartate-semialdehyde dehydrogenase